MKALDGGNSMNKSRRVGKMILSLIPGLLIIGFITSKLYGMGETMTANHELIRRESILHLPEPVQRFLEFSQVIGTPKISHVTLQQVGKFKTAPNKAWVPFTATQVYDIQSASFEWKVRMKMAPLIIVTGTDRLQDGLGSMRIRLFGFIPLVNAKGPELDQGAMTRYLSEIIWFPQAFLDDHITWEPVDSLSAKAIFSIEKKSVEGIFRFDEEGRVTSFSCDRYASEGREMVLRPWRTPVDEYGERSGIIIATRGRAIWDLPEAEYAYVDLEITEALYE